MKITRWLVLSLLLIAALMLAACGGSDDGEEAAGEAGGETAGETGGEETAEEPAATEEPAEEPAEEASGDVVKIVWYVGLGAGSDAPLFDAQEAVVEEFNATHDDIELELQIVANAQAYDVLNTQIAAGNAPDIVGPTGIRGFGGFPGAFLDIQPLIASTGFDLSDYDPALVDFWNIDGSQVGLPFAVFPSFIWFNKDLFDEAGLPYPPQEYGEPYIDVDGNEQEWNLDALRDLSLLLTVDANGNDANSPDFDFNNIVQFGFDNVFGDMRGSATLFGAGNLVDADGNAIMPDHWRTAIEWYYTAMWDEGWYPNGPYGGSTILDGAFQSGNLAMGHTHLWYTCCVGDLGAQFDFAATPSYDGAVTSKLHADTFGILKSTEHPQEAFEVLTYLMFDKAAELSSLYGGMPARLSLQDTYFADQQEVMFGATSGADLDWDVVRASLSYPDNPSHEAPLPSTQESQDRITQFWDLLRENPGLDLDAEIDKLLADLQTIYDAAN